MNSRRTSPSTRGGVHATSERGSALLEWSKVEKVREAGHAFYLFLSKTQAYVLPKYQLANRDEDAAQIRALCCGSTSIPSASSSSNGGNPDGDGRLTIWEVSARQSSLRCSASS